MLSYLIMDIMFSVEALNFRNGVMTTKHPLDPKFHTSLGRKRTKTFKENHFHQNPRTCFKSRKAHTRLHNNNYPHPAFNQIKLMLGLG